MNDTRTPESIEQHVRHTLHTVARSVTGDGLPAVAPTADTRRKPRRKRRVALGVGALTLIPAGIATASVVNQGSEYVAPIPPERIVMEGSVDGSRYLLVESARTGECGEPIHGVELVEENENLLGSEWSTTGYEYGGDYIQKRCGDVIDTSRYLRDPALFNASGAEVGDSFVWVYAVHPDVDTVRITSDDGTEDLKVYEVDGAGYAPFEIPTDITEYTSALIIDGEVVPGSEEQRTLQHP
jgi:hypothetical protein